MKFALVLLIVPAMFLNLVPDANYRTEAAAKDAKPIEFVDITNAAGIRWGIKSPAPGARYIIETMGGGFIDYNGDGLLDIYLVCYS